MTDYVLWKQLTQTDFRAMEGDAAPSGSGGGAVHIALGVNSDKLDVHGFLGIKGAKTDAVERTVKTAAIGGKRDVLVFRKIANRRGGEWIIGDQRGNRHRAWSDASGFPSRFDAHNPPVVLVFRIDGAFHVRLSNTATVRQHGAALPDPLTSETKGVAQIAANVLGLFPDTFNRALGELAEETDIADRNDAFGDDQEDVRRRVLASIVRRQGQPAFRRKLLHAYDGACAITGEKAAWVLEAAHITPYRGPKSNAVSNGLLLRGDIHTLFDLYLMSIDASGQVVTSDLLAGTDYAAFAGKRPTAPGTNAAKPNARALAAHFARFEGG